MNINGVVVCVDYSDYLSKSIDRWARGLDRLLVVTNFTDEDTRKLCSFHRCEVFQTAAFYRNSAVFNKGAAISEAVEACSVLEDWVLFFDADVIPPDDWREIVEAKGCEVGNLYGAQRVMEDGSKNRSDDFELAGYFQLFHADDANVQRSPLLDCSWRHAGGVDSEFQSRWQVSQKRRLPITLLHQGMHGRNWWGIHNTAQMDRMLEDRNKLRKLTEYERIPKQ